MPADVLPTSRPLTIACVQMAMGESVAANRAAAITQIAAAADGGARLVVLPELFASRYFCQCEDHDAFALAEPLGGETATQLAAAARRNAVVVVGSLFERRAPGVFHNTAIVWDADGRRAGIYRKMHIPDDPLYYEKFYFTPGDGPREPAAACDGGFAAFETAVGRVGVIVCWDQWFPEAARLTALHGAEVLCVPTAIGWHPGERAELGAAQHDAWRTVQRSHAIANGIFIAVANRVGHEPTPQQAGEGIDFWGRSFIAGPDGVVIAEADETAGPLVAQVDLGRVEEQRTHWPFLRDRRVDAYGGLTQRWLGQDPA